MKLRLTALAVMLALVVTSAASAQTNVAVVNPARVFNEMGETKDLKQALDAQRQAFENELKARQAKVEELRSKRDLLKPDAPSYGQLDDQLMNEAIQLDTWSKITQAKAQRNQKVQMKVLFDKICKAAEQVAQQKGFTIVVADQRPEVPDNLDQITVEQLRGAINTRNVLFAATQVDLTNDVIALLDQSYKAAGGGTSTAPAPPPPPGAGAAPPPPGGPAPAPAPAPAPTPAPQ